MVFYRKYRSQTINDLDSTAVRQTLLSLLQQPENIPHAFLFTGPKGLGKTSTARIVAKVVNCQGKGEKEKGIEPCNVCEQCVSITNGSNLDVFEIDAASNRGIDEIRDLKEKIRLSPVSAKKKVYIIDEVHMLTTEAFNALLKTLEEPPSHAMFMLCTTEAYKVPDTIVSRCFQLGFKKATNEEIVRALKRVAVGEQLSIDDESLLAIAQMADGGFRDATKLLEEFALHAQGQKITHALLESAARVTKLPVRIATLLSALKVRDTKAGLHVITELLAEGVDLKFFVTQILSDLHTKLLKNVGVASSLPDEFPENLQFSTEEITTLAALFSKVGAEMKNALLLQLPLELAIIEYTSLHQPKDTADLQSAPERSEASSKQRSGPASLNDLRKQVGAMKKLQALYGETKTADAEAVPKIVAEHPVDLMHAFPDGEITKEWLNALWNSIIVEMKQYNHTIAGVLRGCMIRSYDKKTLIIETAYKFHKERLDDTKTRDALCKVCKLLTGNEVAVTIELRK